MSVLAVLDKEGFESLEEPMQKLYREKDEQFFLNISADEAAKLAPNLTGEIERLRNHNEKVLGEKKDLLQKYRELEESRNDAKPDDLKELTARFEAEREKLSKSYEEALAAERAKVEANRKQVASTLKSGVIAKLRADHDLNETAEYVLDRFIQVVPKSEGSEELEARVFENGEPAFVAGHPKTPDNLIQGWLDNKMHLAIFNASGKGGSGGTNNHRGGNGASRTVTRAAFDSMSQSERHSFMKDGGQISD